MTVAAQLNPADEEKGVGEVGNQSDIVQESKIAKDQKD